MVRMKNMQVLISELNIPLENADSMLMKVTANQYKDTKEKTFFPWMKWVNFFQANNSNGSEQ